MTVPPIPFESSLSEWLKCLQNLPIDQLIELGPFLHQIGMNTSSQSARAESLLPYVREEWAVRAPGLYLMLKESREFVAKLSQWYGDAAAGRFIAQTECLQLLSEIEELKSHLSGQPTA